MKRKHIQNKKLLEKRENRLLIKRHNLYFLYSILQMLDSCDRASWMQGEDRETNKMQLIWSEIEIW